MELENLGSILVMAGYEMSPFAEAMINNGFRGNGCGAGFWSFAIAKTAQTLFNVSYCYSCLIHDAEWSIERPLKNRKHRVQSNSDFELNLILESYRGRFSVTRLRLAAAFHAAVAINSPTAYWT